MLLDDARRFQKMWFFIVFAARHLVILSWWTGGECFASLTSQGCQIHQSNYKWQVPTRLSEGVPPANRPGPPLIHDISGPSSPNREFSIWIPMIFDALSDDIYAVSPTSRDLLRYRQFSTKSWKMVKNWCSQKWVRSIQVLSRDM